MGWPIFLTLELVMLALGLVLYVVNEYGVGKGRKALYETLDNVTGIVILSSFIFLILTALLWAIWATYLNGPVNQ
jgi:ribose/xylose/arabinose/galactoside ABC-type transport system permease subunit